MTHLRKYAACTSITFGIKPQFPLFPFQRAGITQLASHQKHILCDQMGLGKTIQGLGVLYEIQHAQNPEQRPHLIVVPLSHLASQWKEELLEKSTWIQDAQIHVITTVRELQALNTEICLSPTFLQGKIIVSTYELIKDINSKKRAERMAKRQKISEDPNDVAQEYKPKVTIPDALEQWFGKQTWSTLICDEIHTMGSIMSYKFDSLRPALDDRDSGIHADHRYALTGTPIKKSMHEVIASRAITDMNFDYKPLKTSLINVANSLGNILTQLKLGGAINKTVASKEETLQQLLIANAGPLRTAIEAIAMTYKEISEQYILRDFSSVRADFQACPNPQLQRHYRVTHVEITLDDSTELQAAINSTDSHWQPRWTQEKGASTVFHVSGQRTQHASEDDAQNPDALLKIQVVKHARAAIYPYKLQKLKNSVLPQLRQPAIITVDNEDMIRILKKDLREFNVFDPTQIDAFKAACSTFREDRSREIEIRPCAINITRTLSERTITTKLTSQSFTHEDLSKHDYLPEKNRVFVHILVTPDWTAQLNKTETDTLTHLDHSERVTQLFEAGTLGMSGLAKAICFGKKDVVQSLVAILGKHGYTPQQLKQHLVQARSFEITNPTIHQRRLANLALFTDTKSAPILIIRTDTTGINLVEAKNLILFEQPKDLATKEQVMARIDRIKQTEDITFYSFPPRTKIDRLYATICSLQEDAMRILVNPKAFSSAEDIQSEESKHKNGHLVAIFFLAKALFEIIQTNIIISELKQNTENQRLFENQKTNLEHLQSFTFSQFLPVFKSTILSTILGRTKPTEAAAGAMVSGDINPFEEDNFSLAGDIFDIDTLTWDSFFDDFAHDDALTGSDTTSSSAKPLDPFDWWG